MILSQIDCQSKASTQVLFYSTHDFRSSSSENYDCWNFEISKTIFNHIFKHASWTSQNTFWNQLYYQQNDHMRIWMWAFKLKLFWILRIFPWSIFRTPDNFQLQFTGLNQNFHPVNLFQIDRSKHPEIFRMVDGSQKNLEEIFWILSHHNFRETAIENCARNKITRYMSWLSTSDKFG